MKCRKNCRNDARNASGKADAGSSFSRSTGPEATGESSLAGSSVGVTPVLPAQRSLQLAHRHGVPDSRLADLLHLEPGCNPRISSSQFFRNTVNAVAAAS